MASKKLKQHCEEGNGGDDEPNTMGVDLISELPDPLIQQILSFLPTFHVVQMSVLSKHWRRMSSWTCVPVLYFEEFNDVTFRKMEKSNSKCSSSFYTTF